MTARRLSVLVLIAVFSLLLGACDGRAAVVACDGDAVRSLSQCDGAGNCLVTGDFLCDASCGAECRYVFAAFTDQNLVGTLVSTGPPIHIEVPKGFIRVAGPWRDGGFTFTSAPGIVGAPGGRVTIKTLTLYVLRPIRVEGGTVEMRAHTDAYRPTGVLDVSSPQGGGTIEFLEGSVGTDAYSRLLAKGTGPEAPGGTIIVTAPGAYLGWHGLMDVSGARGGNILLNAPLWAHSEFTLLAHGRNGDGGRIEIDASADPISPTIEIGDCGNTPYFDHPYVQRSRIRLDGRNGRGGTMLLRGSEYIEVCAPVNLAGTAGGGTLVAESIGGIWFGRVKARGGYGSPGGVVKLLAASELQTFGTIDVGGSPAGSVELRSDDLAWLHGRVRADSTRTAGGAGSILLGELNDPPSIVPFYALAINNRISARSRAGPAGSITIRKCLVAAEDSPMIVASGGKTSGGGQILIQSRAWVRLPETIRAGGAGAGIRVEYVTEVMPGELASPEPELFQYPNPGCDCTMSFAQCMQAP
jgi:hypothetical protein